MPRKAKSKPFQLENVELSAERQEKIDRLLDEIPDEPIDVPPVDSLVLEPEKPKRKYVRKAKKPEKPDNPEISEVKSHVVEVMNCKGQKIKNIKIVIDVMNNNNVWDSPDSS